LKDLVLGIESLLESIGSAVIENPVTGFHNLALVVGLSSEARVAVRGHDGFAAAGPVGLLHGMAFLVMASRPAMITRGRGDRLAVHAEDPRFVAVARLVIASGPVMVAVRGSDRLTLDPENAPVHPVALRIEAVDGAVNVV